MASYGYGRQVGLASPPPSDGLIPPSSPIEEHASLSRNHRRERRHAVLTPRKFKRFFTPRSQRTPQNRRILEDSRDSALNARPTPPKSSQDAPDLDSPIRHSRASSLDPNPKVESRKRKRTASSESLSGNHVRRPLGVDIPANKRGDFSSEAGASDAMQVDFAETRSAETISPASDSMSTHRTGPSHPKNSQAPLPELISTHDNGTRRNDGLANFSRRRLFSRTSLSSNPPRLHVHEGTIPHSDDGPTEEKKQKGALVSTATNATPLLASDQDVSRPKAAALTDYFKTRRGGVTRERDVKSSKPVTLPRSTMETTMSVPGYHPKGVVKLRNRGFDAQRLLREQGLTPRPGRQHLLYPEHDPYIATSKFFSRKTDYLPCNSHSESNGGTTIPFSLASAHSMPWTAIGDEEGFIRCFNTQPSHASVDTVEDKVKWSVQYHNNAIMDLAFSSDDLRLATACGDRNGKVIDFMTQKVAVELNDGHDQSMRRVKFQPGRASGDVIATSDKDGRIQIWDLRCSSSPGLSFTVNDACRGPFSQASLRLRDPNLPPVPARPINTFNDAHTRLAANDAKPASVTALEYVTGGREHLLLSGCEGDARIKLWDTRYVTPRNQTVATPLSVTDAPATHKWRPYGLTSMALNTEATRLYAVCKDNTVYCYSTNHLMLGEAPELTAKPPRQRPGEAKRGLGPLYGFRHEQLEVKSFYVRCAVRSNLVACPGPELLAVGSSTGCPILFPTDEASMREAWDRKSQMAHRPPPRQPNHHQQRRRGCDDDDNGSDRNDAIPYPQNNSSDDGFPIVRNGTSLVNGHVREATGVSWTPNGSLVTISDDNSMRHWQEMPTEGAGDPGYEEVPRDARDLRTCGNGGSKRFGCGWAYTGKEPYPNAPIVSGWDRDDDPDIWGSGTTADEDGCNDPDFDEE